MNIKMNINDNIQNIFHLINEIDSAYHDLAFKLGMTDSTMGILYTVCLSGGECPISELISVSGLSKQTVNSALRKLEGEGIITTEILDGKKKKIVLTDYGREFAEDKVFKMVDIENQVYGEFSKEELETYIGLTRKFYENFRRKVDEF